MSADEVLKAVCYVHCVQPETGCCVLCRERIKKPMRKSFWNWLLGYPEIYESVYTEEAIRLMPKFEDLSAETQEKIRWIDSMFPIQHGRNKG